MARRDPEEWFWQVGTELQRLTHEMIRSGQTVIRRKFWEPRVDVLENDDHIILRAEIAGVRGDEIQLVYNADDHSILISGNRHEEGEPDVCRTGCYQLEIYYGEFEREVHLPESAVEPRGMKAHYRNGILTVRVPKLKTDAPDES